MIIFEAIYKTDKTLLFLIIVNVYDMIAHRHEVLHFVEATLSTGRDFKEQK